MHTHRIRLALAFATALAATAAVASDGNRKVFSTQLFGYEEVPAVNTPATGLLELRIANNEESVSYTLSYSGLKGTVTQAHIHFAQKGVNGGIMVWLCGTTITTPPLSGPPGTPPCPSPGGSVSGTLGAGQVVGPAANQQIPAGDLASVIDALRNGVAYGNVHTTLSPGGEIRGQIGTSQP